MLCIALYCVFSLYETLCCHYTTAQTFFTWKKGDFNLYEESLLQWVLCTCQLNTNWFTHCSTEYTRYETRKLSGKLRERLKRSGVLGHDRLYWKGDWIFGSSTVNSFTPARVLKRTAYPHPNPAPLILPTSAASLGCLSTHICSMLLLEPLLSIQLGSFWTGQTIQKCAVHVRKNTQATLNHMAEFK